MEAARQLELADAGYVFHMLADKGLPLPRLPDDFVKIQLQEARNALDDCLLDPATGNPAQGEGRSPATA